MASSSLNAVRSFSVRRNASVALRVRLEYWISFMRVATAARSVGTSPRALHRSTWNTSVCRRERADSTQSSGVFDTMPPSQ